MKFLHRAAVPSAVALMALTAAPASAASTTIGCQNQGKLQAKVSWTYTSTGHRWTSASFQLDGRVGGLVGDFGGKSNVYFTMKENGVTKFSQEAPPKNAVKMRTSYTFDFADFTTTSSKDENWYVRAVFDTPWETDYECTAVLDY